MTDGHLQIVVCGAAPAADATKLLRLAQERNWSAAVTATPASLDFFDLALAEEISGRPVKTSYQATISNSRATAAADALIIAPATFNTINKIAAGIADNYALASAAELIGRGVPTVIVPFVNSALARRPPFGNSIAALQAEGIRVLTGPIYGWEPHVPGRGAERLPTFPWAEALRLATDQVV
ncbi:flavoprotein [Hamadaea tsunoensis]|uniref:flavoprotein n=1 Tax=Hamadaea tsunoensis TaxID=53368 RepID=UPI000A0478D1|nr:flavoprotein [Hamadaea tsunoensis]